MTVQVPKVKAGAVFKFDHKLCAMELIASTVCVTCVLKEGRCKSNCNSGNYEESFKKCWWFSQAVKKVSGVLDVYDK